MLPARGNYCARSFLSSELGLPFHVWCHLHGATQAGIDGPWKMPGIGDADKRWITCHHDAVKDASDVIPHYSGDFDHNIVSASSQVGADVHLRCIVVGWWCLVAVDLHTEGMENPGHQEVCAVRRAHTGWPLEAGAVIPQSGRISETWYLCPWDERVQLVGGVELGGNLGGIGQVGRGGPVLCREGPVAEDETARYFPIRWKRVVLAIREDKRLVAWPSRDMKLNRVGRVRVKLVSLDCGRGLNCVNSRFA